MTGHTAPIFTVTFQSAVRSEGICVSVPGVFGRKPHALVSNGSLPGELQSMNMETWLKLVKIQKLQCISLKAEGANTLSSASAMFVLFHDFIFLAQLPTSLFRTIEC